MIFDVELNCDKWKDCKTKWCNGDGGFWCKEDCKPITPIVCRWNLDEEGEEMSRLIDVDKLLEELRQYHPLSISYGILSDIEYFPTAYDVENVVKIFEEKARNCQNNAKYYGEKAEWMSKAYRDAIEVVKGGVK